VVLLRVNDVKVNLTKGFRGESVLFRPAAQRKMKALKFAYRDRRQKNAIYVVFGLRINAAARLL
jgi:ribosomal protein L20